jgi:hypothetical protein
VQAHGGAAMRNKSEDVNNLLDPKGRSSCSITSITSEWEGNKRAHANQAEGKKKKKGGGTHVHTFLMQPPKKTSQETPKNAITFWVEIKHRICTPPPDFCVKRF